MNSNQNTREPKAPPAAAADGPGRALRAALFAWVATVATLTVLWLAPAAGAWAQTGAVANTPRPAATPLATLPAVPRQLPSQQPLACLILPDKVADVGSQVIGVIESIEVERGDMVKKGQIVARLRADVERASTSVAVSRADSEGDLRGAIAARELAKLKFDRAVSLNQQNFVSTQAVELAKSEYDVAHEKVGFAREQLATSSREVSVSQAQVSQRIVRSPIDGVVIERYLNAGERVEEKPMLKVASVSLLRVEVVAPTALFGTLAMGQEVSVQPDLPNSGPRNARITQIDKVLDPASNTFRVRLALPNDDGALPGGLRCRVVLAPKGEAAGTTSTQRLLPVAGTAADRR